MLYAHERLIMLPCCDVVAVAVVVSVAVVVAVAADFANVKHYNCLQKKMLPIEAPTRQGGGGAAKDCQRICYCLRPVRLD